MLCRVQWWLFYGAARFIKGLFSSLRRFGSFFLKIFLIGAEVEIKLFVDFVCF